jgi:hypothetical protein
MGEIENASRHFSGCIERKNLEKEDEEEECIHMGEYY